MFKVPPITYQNDQNFMEITNTMQSNSENNN